MNTYFDRIQNILNDNNYMQHLASNDLSSYKEEIEKETESKKIRHVKSYKPRKSTLEKFGAGTDVFSRRFGMSFENLTPFLNVLITEGNDNNISVKLRVKEILEEYISPLLSNDQIIGMDNETREVVIELIMNLVRNAFEEHKNRFFKHGYLYPDQIELRTEHIIQYGMIAIEISEQDYEDFKQEFLNSVERIIRNSFEAARYSIGNVFKIEEDIENKSLFLFYLRFLQKFDFTNDRTLKLLCGYFMDIFSIDSDMKINEYVEDYKKLKKCPITECFINNYKENDFSLDTMLKFHIYITDMDFQVLEKVLSHGNYDKLIDNIISTYENYRKIYKEEKPPFNFDDTDYFLYEALPGLKRLHQFVSLKG